MGRPLLISDEALLAAARAELLHSGARVTTAAIAERAGISEAILFRRFRSKHELIHAAIDAGFQEAFLLDATTGSLTRAHLRAIAHKLAAHFRTIVPLVLVSMAHLQPGERPPSLTGSEPPVKRVVEQLSAFFAMHVGRGDLRCASPQTLAHTFAGTLWHFSFMTSLLDEGARPTTTVDVFVKDLVAMLWLGVGPRKRGARTIGK
jgi:AcrR family transcriptional regulator